MEYLDNVWSRARRKGPIFAINVLVFGGLAIFLLWSFAWPDGIISKRNTLARLMAVCLAATFFYYSFLFGRRGNNWLAAIFAVLVITAEMFLRVVGTFEVGHTSFEWRQPQPYFMFSGPRGETVDIPKSMGGSDADRIARFNEDGFRIDGEVVKPKPPNEVRIFVLGGSTVMLGAPLSKTIPGIIETELRSAGLEQVRVYNFGGVGFVSGQELSLLVHHLAALEPDLVIAYDGGNDLYEPWLYDPRPGYPFNFLAWEAAIAPIPHAQTRTISDLIEDSALGRFLLDPKEQRQRGTLRALRQQVEFGTANWQRKIVDNYVANIVAACRFSRSNNFLFAEFFQPTLHFSLNLNPDQVKLAGGEQLIQGMRNQRAGVQAAFAQGTPLNDPGCRFSDLSRTFETQGSERYWDLIHVDNRGNEVIGKQIAEELLMWEVFRKRIRSVESKR